MEYHYLKRNNKITNPLTHIKWCWWRDSNSQPTDYKSVALPIELHQRNHYPFASFEK